MNLAQPEKYTNYVAVKVRVIAKSELRSGLRHAMFPWTMFDMHVINLAGAEVWNRKEREEREEELTNLSGRSLCGCFSECQEAL